jgi:cyanophycin synthetase
LLLLGQAVTQWALAALNEVRGFVQHAGAVRVGQALHLWLGFHRAELSRAALQLALTSLTRHINRHPDPEPIGALLEKLWLACRQHHPDFQARILMVAAQADGIPFFRFLEESRQWQFGWGWGARSTVFFETATNADGALGWQWERNKVISKDLMRSIGLPVPSHVLVREESELPAVAAQVGLPCVVKPLDGGGGKGVTANIRDTDSLRLAFRQARLFSSGPLLVEQHLQGLDYRLMVVDGRLVAAIRREASFVVGNGQTTVGELIAHLNASRSENLVRSRYLKPIETT